MRALVADDDSWIREMNSETLREMGFLIVAVTSGDDALWAMKHHGFDLLVLDNRMPPGLTGKAILLELRAAGDYTPVVLATGDSNVLRRQSWPSYATLLEKPYMPSDLEEAVRGLLPGLAS